MKKQKSLGSWKTTKDKATALSQLMRRACLHLEMQAWPVEISAVQVKHCPARFSLAPNNLTAPLLHSPVAEARQSLFYKAFSTAPPRFLPVVFHPEIEPARVNFTNSCHKPAGIYLSIEQQGRVKEALSHWPAKDVCLSASARAGESSTLARTESAPWELGSAITAVRLRSCRDIRSSGNT